MARCPECGLEASEDMQFCAQCHHTMYYRCRSVGITNKLHSRAKNAA